MKEIKISDLRKIEKEYLSDKACAVARHALSNTDISVVALTKDLDSEKDFQFDIDLKTMPVTDQKASGRCWIFAACNFMREIIGKKIGVKNFELSQSYIAFYDKLEKLNFTLNALIETINEDYDDRTVQYLVSNGIGDGGQWDMIVNIVKKYGICPKNVYGETATSSGTRMLNLLLNTELRKFASEAREVKAKKGMKAVEELKESYVKRFYKALISCYGVPPTKFDFKYVDSKDKFKVEKGFTPNEFFEKYIGSKLDDYVSIIDAPTKSKPYGKSYTVKYLGNVEGGKIVKHLNLPMERMKELIISQLKDGEVVWYGSDVAFYRDNITGSWDDEMFDFKYREDIDKANGYLFSTKLIDELKSCQIESIAISLDGPERVHDKYRQSGSFQRAMQAIDTLTENDIPVSVISTLHSENVLHLEEMFEILKPKGIFAWQLQACSPMGNAANGGIDVAFDPNKAIWKSDNLCRKSHP